MGHDQREGSPIISDLPMTSSTKRRNEIIKCLQEVRKSKNDILSSLSSTEMAPKSPLSKAFDFLPWSKSKKTNTSIVDKKDELNQKNTMVRNSGIIRDILSDKLNKNKTSQQQQQQRNSMYSPLSIKNNRKNTKRISRNKSLDIEEILKKYEEQLKSDEDSISVTTFLDDTYIENYIKNDSEQEYYQPYQKQTQQQSSPQITKKDFNENVTGKNLNSQKHILFNDENVIYLIRKEKPTIRSGNLTNTVSGGSNKEKSIRGTLKQKNEDNNNGNRSSSSNNIYTDGNIIRARLKFQKVPKGSQDDSDITLNSQTKDSFNSGSGCRRGGIFNRQQSLDSQLVTNSSSSGNRRTPPETILENFSCTRSNNNGDENTETDRQKMLVAGNGSGKPRKKLSFRDPVVSCRTQKNSMKADENQINNNNNNNNDNNNNWPTTIMALSKSEQLTNKIIPLSYDSDLESQAMRIVRTVGQAFEVCHKYSNQKNSLENNDERSDLSSDILDQDRISEQLSDDELIKKEHISTLPDSNSSMQRPNQLELVPQINNGSSNNYNNRKSPGIENDKSPGSPMSSAREIQKLKEQLEQQALQTRQALSQLMLVREQLISETNARIEAQARTQQLLQQNRELLEHLASLGGYTEPSQSGLTSANIALAPQSQLHMLLQQQQDQTSDLTSSLRKTYLSSPNNNNISSITQQLNNLGSINQQLTTLSHQLSGLNQQSQNLQNFQNLGNIQTMHTTPNAFPNLNQIQSISKKLSNLSQTPTTTTDAAAFTQNDLYQMNQELLNRLQALNLGFSAQSTSNGNIQNLSNHNNGNNNSSPQNSFFFANPGHLSSSPNNNNNNFNFLSSPGSLGNLTPSPMGTINRKSYSTSPMPMDESLAISIEKNLNSMDEAHFIKPLSQVGTLTTLDPDGKVKVIVPVSNGDSYSGGGGEGSNGSDTNSSCMRRDGGSSPNRRNNDHNVHSISLNVPTNTVTLKVTDESGKSRKLSATPSFITRSTSEKVPNRSQMMSQVQRTAWARHTTK